MLENPIPAIGKLVGPEDAPRPGPAPGRASAERFVDSLKEAIHTVDALQHESEAAQASYAQGEPVDLHDVLIKVEQADIAFRTMMEVRNKLVDAYREIMRMGSGG